MYPASLLMGAGAGRFQTKPIEPSLRETIASGQHLRFLGQVDKINRLQTRDYPYPIVSL